MMLLHSWFVRKALLGLVAVSVLTLCSCKTSEPVSEPVWNDMYELRSYQVEVITNEIVTTVFISAHTETNRLVKIAEPVTDFGGYEFAPFVPATNDFVDIEPPSRHTQEFEFQCLDGSCAK